MTPEVSRAREITKKVTRLAAIPATVTLAWLSAGCGPISESTHFPACSQDPQTKTQTLIISYRDFNRPNRHREANVDGVVFQLVNSNPNRIDIKSEDNRIQSVEPGHIQFEGVSDGRTYDILYNSDSLGRRELVSIIATCTDTDKQPTP